MINPDLATMTQQVGAMLISHQVEAKFCSGKKVIETRRTLF